MSCAATPWRPPTAEPTWATEHLRTLTATTTRELAGDKQRDFPQNSQKVSSVGHLLNTFSNSRISPGNFCKSILGISSVHRYFCETLLDYEDPCPSKEQLRSKILSRLTKEGSTADEPANIALSDYSSLSSADLSLTDDEHEIGQSGVMKSSLNIYLSYKNTSVLLRFVRCPKAYAKAQVSPREEQVVR